MKQLIDTMTSDDTNIVNVMPILWHRYSFRSKEIETTNLYSEYWSGILPMTLIYWN